MSVPRLNWKVCPDCHINKRRCDYASSNGKIAMRCYKCMAKWLRDYRVRNFQPLRGKILDRRLKERYGISLADFEIMRDKQGGRCAICRMPPPKNERLCVDHCHEKARVRGLLCRKCNRGIGLLGDDPKIVKQALDYLRRRYGSTPVDIDKGY